MEWINLQNSNYSITYRTLNNVLYLFLEKGITEQRLINVFPQLGKSTLGQYDDLTDIIYKLSEEDFEKLQGIFGVGVVGNYPFQQFVSTLPQNPSTNNIVNSFERHVRLCCHQRNFILKVSKQAEEISKQAKANAEEAIGLKNKIYSEFIAILGIFTAISFAMMGSVQALGNLFSDIQSPTLAKVGYMLIAAGIYLIVLFSLIVALFAGMKQVVKNKEKYQWNWHLVTFIVVVTLSLLGLGIGIFILKG